MLFLIMARACPFIYLQKDGTYMFNLEGLIPKLCQVAQEVGDDERTEHLRAAGLQALSAMVCLCN